MAAAEPPPPTGMGFLGLLSFRRSATAVASFDPAQDDELLVLDALQAHVADRLPLQTPRRRLPRRPHHRPRRRCGCQSPGRATEAGAVGDADVGSAGADRGGVEAEGEEQIKKNIMYTRLSHRS